MNIIITGATGFIGKHLTRKLVQSGHNVSLLCRPSSHLEPFKDLPVKIIHGDITNCESLNKAFKNQDWVFHLAGVIEYKESARALMEKVNVQGTQNVLDACLNQSVQKLLLLSSVVAVGALTSSKDQPLNETSDYNMSDYEFGYFETKRKAEDIVLKAAKNKKIWAVAVNPSTVYGPEDMKKKSRKFQRKVAQGKFPFYTKGGVSIVHVKDVVQACETALLKGQSGERYILSGENITIQELFKYIAEAAQISPPKILLPKVILSCLGALSQWLKFFGIHFPISKQNTQVSSMYHWFDSSKAQKELNFSTPSAKDCIQESVDWYLLNR